MPPQNLFWSFFSFVHAILSAPAYKMTNEFPWIEIHWSFCFFMPDLLYDALFCYWVTQRGLGRKVYRCTYQLSLNKID